MLLIHSILPSSSVNGPGNRLVVWTQGCTLQCPGCWNTQTHAFVRQNDLNEASVICELAMATGLWSQDQPMLEGVTFSGGEPMQQVEELASLMEWIHKKWRHLSIGMYTGYSRRELDKGDFTTFRYAGPARRLRAWKKIQEHLDFAVMGRFNQGQRSTSRPLCSSRNQKLVLFSDRYKLTDFRPQEAEVTITDDLVSITGFPTGDLS